jgi:4-carboxymuconolactone decarboxylase
MGPAPVSTSMLQERKMLTPSQAEMFRRMTIGDDALMTSLFSSTAHGSDALDDRTSSLVRLAALMVAGADSPAIQLEVRNADNAGATTEQIIGVLVAIARVAGSTLVMSAAPKVALALGYDVDAGFEDTDARDHERDM